MSPDTGHIVEKGGPALLLALLVVASVYACYPKRIGPTSPDGERLTWAEMDMPQRKAHMRNVILPLAADVFQAWRPERYADVDCTLCHGNGAHWENYQMPTGHLPRLSGALLLGPEFEKHPDTTRLKLDHLVPEMAQALGLRPFSIITRRGFGCYTCHLGPDGPQFGN